MLLGRHPEAPEIPGSVVTAPVAVEEGAVIENCVVGPHVSVASGARLRNTIVRDSIINQNARVEDAVLEGSVIGDHAVVRGRLKRINVGDSSEVEI